MHCNRDLAPRSTTARIVQHVVGGVDQRVADVGSFDRFVPGKLPHDVVPHDS